MEFKMEFKPFDLKVEDMWELRGKFLPYIPDLGLDVKLLKDDLLPFRPMEKSFRLQVVEELKKYSYKPGAEFTVEPSWFNDSWTIQLRLNTVDATRIAPGVTYVYSMVGFSESGSHGIKLSEFIKRLVYDVTRQIETHEIAEFLQYGQMRRFIQSPHGQPTVRPRSRTPFYGDLMKLNRMIQKELARYHYKPKSHFSFLMGEDRKEKMVCFVLHSLRPNSVKPTEEIAITTNMLVHVERLRDNLRATISQTLQDLCRQQEMHEMDEFLKYEGKPVNQPHPEYLER